MELFQKIKEFDKKNYFHWAAVSIVIIIAALIIFSWYGYNRIEDLTSQINTLVEHINSVELNLSSTTVSLEKNIAKTQTSFSESLQQEKQNVSAIKSELGGFQDKVGAISGTVTTLEKLSKTDPELLQKYSKVFFLNEHYQPARLVEITNKYKYSESKILQAHDKVWPYLKNMIDQALKEGVDIFVFSAFRSFDTQSVLKGQYTITYGEGTANQFSADQGYSEHQLGTTFDLITKGLGGTLSGFEKTKAYTWLLGNAYKYGFVLSYSEGNQYYVFEPWHWRFVGVGLATHLHDIGKNFYDLTQREIDEYLVSIFD